MEENLGKYNEPRNRVLGFLCIFMYPCFGGIFSVAVSADVCDVVCVCVRVRTRTHTCVLVCVLCVTVCVCVLSICVALYVCL